MEMTYQNSMVLPKNFAQHTKDEMMYLDGGGTVTFTLRGSTAKWICSGVAGGSIAGIAGEICLYVTGATLNPAAGLAIGLVSAYFAEKIITYASGRKTWPNITKRVTRDWLPNANIVI